MDHSSQTETSVNAMLRGDESRFFLAQPSAPVVRTGGGKSGCDPGV